MKIKQCRICGQQFMPNSCRQVDCGKPIEKICAVCGNSYIGKCSKNDTSHTCSKKCQHIYSKMRSEEEYRKNNKRILVLDNIQ